MGSIIHEQVRHHEVVEIGKMADSQVELHKRLAAECSGGSHALKEVTESRLPGIFDKVKKRLDSGDIDVETATEVRTFLSFAISTCNDMRRTLDAQRLREEGATGVLMGIVKRLEKRRDDVNAKIDLFESHAKAQEADPDISVGGAPRGGIMAQRRQERLAEEAEAKAGADTEAATDTTSEAKPGADDDVPRGRMSRAARLSVALANGAAAKAGTDDKPSDSPEEPPPVAADANGADGADADVATNGAGPSAAAMSEAATQGIATAMKKRGRGRPKGSKNKPKAQQSAASASQ